MLYVLRNVTGAIIGASVQSYRDATIDAVCASALDAATFHDLEFAATQVDHHVAAKRRSPPPPFPAPYRLDTFANDCPTVALTHTTDQPPVAIEYQSLSQRLLLIEGPAGEAIRALYRSHWEFFAQARGSRRAHQAWGGTTDSYGGYVGHIADGLNIGVALYATLSAMRPLGFALGDWIAVFALHDIEKPFIYFNNHPLAIVSHDHDLDSKAGRAAFREALLAHHGIALTPDQENAMRYVEGEFDYVPGERRMMPMAAFAAVVDLLSARVWYDYPTRDDPWPGAAMFGRGHLPYVPLADAHQPAAGAGRDTPSAS